MSMEFIRFSYIPNRVHYDEFDKIAIITIPKKEIYLFNDDNSKYYVVTSNKFGGKEYSIKKETYYIITEELLN